LGFFLVIIVTFSAEYYRQVRKAQKEYLKARDIIEEIVLSFNRELKHQSERLDIVTFKVEGESAKADGSAEKTENVEKKIQFVQEQIDSFSQSRTAITQNVSSIISAISELQSKFKGAEATQEQIRAKVVEFEEKIQKIIEIPEIVPEPVIPLKRDKAMATLTDTEVQVLEMLSQEGPKTAPEIKERVSLSREHTARLMKKLYEEGYVEREIGKIPFRYSIKAEMEKLLKKTENTHI